MFKLLLWLLHEPPDHERVMKLLFVHTMVINYVGLSWTLQPYQLFERERRRKTQLETCNVKTVHKENKMDSFNVSKQN